MLRPSIEGEFRFVTGQPTFYVKPRKSHMETNISNRSETESQNQAHTQREASGSGKVIILQENQSWTLDCLQFLFFFPLSLLMALWHEVHLGLVPCAGPADRPAFPCWSDDSSLLQSVLQDANKRKEPAKTQTHLSFKVRLTKQINVQVLLSFHCLCVAWTDRKWPIKVC